MPEFDIQSTQALFGNAGTRIVFHFCHTDVERANARVFNSTFELCPVPGQFVEPGRYEILMRLLDHAQLN